MKTIFNNKFLLLNNHNELGKFKLFHGDINYRKDNCLIPVFKIKENEIENEKFDFISGFLSSENEFYECPLLIFYVEIHIVNNFNDEANVNLNSKLKVYSKDFNKYKIIEVKIQKPLYWHYNNNIEIKKMNTIINSLNNYIERNNDLEDLKENYFMMNEDLTPPTNKEILKLVNNLKFDFYSNGQHLVGKDDAYWYEVEIKNLPKNNYLAALFYKILNFKKSVCESINLSRIQLIGLNELYAEYGGGRGSCGSDISGERIKISPDINKMEEIKDFLKINLMDLYDPINYENELLKKELKKIQDFE